MANKGESTILRDKLNSLLTERQSLKDKRSQADRRLTALEKEIDDLNKQLALSEPAPLVISDHAMLRYLERKYSLDMEELRSEVLPQDPNVVNAINKLGSGTFPVGESHKLVVKGNTIITILT